LGRLILLALSAAAAIAAAGCSGSAAASQTAPARSVEEIQNEREVPKHIQEQGKVEMR